MLAIFSCNRFTLDSLKYFGKQLTLGILRPFSKKMQITGHIKALKTKKTKGFRDLRKKPYLQAELRSFQTLREKTNQI
jgi:hypothetical protein